MAKKLTSEEKKARAASRKAAAASKKAQAKQTEELKKSVAEKDLQKKKDYAVIAKIAEDKIKEEAQEAKARREELKEAEEKAAEEAAKAKKAAAKKEATPKGHPCVDLQKTVWACYEESERLRKELELRQHNKGNDPLVGVSSALMNAFSNLRAITGE